MKSCLLNENNSLKAENKGLKAKLGIVEQQTVMFNESPKAEAEAAVNKNSESKEKIELFMALFKARSDVYAKRWQNKEWKSGYAPVCLNEWRSGVCGKPKVKCADCECKSYRILDER